MNKLLTAVLPGLCLAAAFANTTLTLEGGLAAPFVHAGSVEADTLRASVVVTTPRWEIVPDYVFDTGYRLPALSETEAYVRAHRHLPGMPGAAQIAAQGLDLTDMNLKLLKAVEELTLHVIALDKRSGKLEALAQALKGVPRAAAGISPERTARESRVSPDTARQNAAPQRVERQAAERDHRQRMVALAHGLRSLAEIDSMPGLNERDRQALRRRHKLLNPLD